MQVDDLKAKLAIQEIELKAKNDAADALIEIVGIETEKVSKEKGLGRSNFPFLVYFFLKIDQKR